jgi:hypothetical protein
MAEPRRPPDDLERKIFELLLAFPERIDEMETRNEENCRLLAAELADLFRKESARRPGTQ